MKTKASWFDKMTILKKPPLRRFVMTIILMGLLIGFFLFFWKMPAINPLDRGQTQLAQPATIGKGLFPNLSIIPPDLKTGSLPTAKLVGFTYYFQIQKNEPLPNNLCIDTISIIETEPGQGWFGNSGFYNTTFPICFELVKPVFQSMDGYVLFELTPKASDDLSTQLFNINSHLWYPYDDFQLSLGMELGYRVLHDNQELINDFIYPQFFISVPTSIEWNAKANEINVKDTFVAQGYNTDMKKMTTIAFTRPMFMKVIYPLLIAVMAFFILLLSLVDSVDTFVEGGVAVFFGIFGLKQIILPSTVEIITIWDFAIWGLVIVFAAALIDHLISGFRRVSHSEDKIQPEGEIEPDNIPISSIPGIEPSESPTYGVTNGNNTALVAFIGIGILGWIFSRIFRRDGK